MFVDVAAAFDVPELLEDAVLIRQAPGRYDDDGIWVSGNPTEIDIQVVAAPMSGEDREVLPEGIREKDVRNFWFLEEAEAVVPGASGGDAIRYGGDFWRIVTVKDWGGFREAVGVRPEGNRLA